MGARELIAQRDIPLSLVPCRLRKMVADVFEKIAVVRPTRPTGRTLLTVGVQQSRIRSGGFLRRPSDEVIEQVVLPCDAAPAWDGIAAANGLLLLLLSMADGRIVCMGPQ